MKKIYFHKEDKGLYTNNFEKIDSFDTAKYMEKAKIEQMNSENICSTYNRSKSGIQSTYNSLEVIGFRNRNKEQTRKPVKNKDVIAYLADTSVFLNNNKLTFKNNRNIYRQSSCKTVK